MRSLPRKNQARPSLRRLIFACTILLTAPVISVQSEALPKTTTYSKKLLLHDESLSETRGLSEDDGNSTILTTSSSPISAPDILPTDISHENLNVTTDAPTSAPVANDQTTDSPTSAPVVNTEISKAPTGVPVVKTETSESPSGAPVVKTETTDQPTSAPVVKTETSEAPSGAPVVKTATTDQPTSAPVVKTETSEAPSGAPVVKTVTTDQPTSAPVAKTMATDQPTSAPVAKTVATDQPTSAPVAKTATTDAPTSVKTVTTDAPTISNTSKTPGGGDDSKDDDESTGGPAKPVWFFALALLGMGFWLYRKRAGGVVPHHGELPKRYHRSNVYEGVSPHEAEVVNLNRHDSDDWGWDDDNNSGDVELAAGGSFAKQSYHDEPSPKSAPPIRGLVRRTASKDKEVDLPAPKAKKGLSLSASSKATPTRKPLIGGVSSPAVQQPQLMAKLGHKKTQKTSPPPKTKPKADDFFAEMGLATTPSTFATRTAPKPAAAATTTTRSRMLYTASTSDDDLGGDEWGDDADLDDLLND